MNNNNCLHYYIDLLRMEDGEERSPEQTEGCVAALHNVIRSMRASRRDKICGEDFSRLDFGNIPLNGIHFSRDGEQPCWFDGCRMNEWNFMSGHSLAITTVAWSHNRKHILTGSRDGTAILWDARTYLMLRKYKVTDMENMSDAAFSSDGKYFALTSFDEIISIINIETGKCIHVLKGCFRDVIHVNLSNDGKYCLISSNQNGVHLWSIETEKIINSFEGFLGIFMNDKKSCVITDRNTIMIYNYKTGELLRSTSDLTDFVYSIDISADDKKISAGLYDHTVVILDSSSLDVLQILKGHSGYITATAFSTNHKLCLTASCDNTAKLWDTESGDCLHTLAGHLRFVTSAAFSNADKGALCLTGSLDGTIKIWNIKTGKCIKTLDGFSSWVNAVAVSKNRKYCLGGTREGQIRIWSMISGRCIKTFKGDSSEITSLALSSDNNYFFTGTRDFCLYLWDNSDESKSYILAEDYEDKCQIFFSPDGKKCLSGNSTITVWNCKTREIVMKLMGHKCFVSAFAFSPDGRYFLTGSFDRSAKKWDFECGKCLITFEGHSQSVRSVDISLNGELCLTGSKDHTAIIWNFKTGKHIRTLSGHSEGIVFVKFLPDGKYYLTQSFDHTVKIWNISTGECVKTISTSKCGEYSEATFPFSVLKENGRLYIYQLDLNDFETVKEIGSFYNINKLFVENCSFRNIDANRKVKDILYQYGGDITEQRL